MRNCIDEATLQSWFDGELSADAAAEVAAHVNSCPQCAEAMHELENENAVVSHALSMEFSATVPTERLRRRIDDAVAGLHSARVPIVNQSVRSRLNVFFASFRPLAYVSMAAVILLVVFLGMLSLKREKPPTVTVREPARETIQPAPQASPEPKQLIVGQVPHEPTPVHRKALRTIRTPETAVASLTQKEDEYERTIARLNESMQAKPPMRPSLQVEYAHNLAVIDNAIAATRDVARKNPKDPQAAQFMLAAYQSKVDLINQFADARTLEK